MKNMNKKIPAFLIFFIFCSFSASAFEQSPKEILKMGVISDDARERIKKYLPFVEYLAKNVDGYSGGQVVVAETVNEMIDKFKNKQVDIIFETPFATAELERTVKVLPSLIVWKKGVREYRTIFFARKDSDINSLSDLKGKVVSFENPSSTSAFGIPKAEMQIKGLSVVNINNADNSKDSVLYFFAGEEINQVFAVLKKKANAGSFSNNDWDELPDSLRSNLKIIHETPPILRMIGSFSSTFSQKKKIIFTNKMIDMHNSEKGRDLLYQMSGINKIEEMTPEDYQAFENFKDYLTHDLD